MRGTIDSHLMNTKLHEILSFAILYMLLERALFSANTGRSLLYSKRGFVLRVFEEFP